MKGPASSSKRPQGAAFPFHHKKAQPEDTVVMQEGDPDQTLNLPGP